MVKFVQMQLLNVIKKYVIDSQLFVSLMGTLLTVFFMLEQNIFRWPTVLLVFITFFSGYTYTKYQNHRIFKKILVLNVLCGLISMLLIILNHNEIRLLKWMVIVLLGLLYNSKFLENSIRKLPLLKIFYVGLTWALINAWLILPHFNMWIFLINILFVSALVLPFDIRDMKEDDVITFPKLIGVANTKIFGSFLLVVSAVLAYYFLNHPFSYSFVLACLISLILIIFSRADYRDSYFSFWVESCSGLPLLFLLLLKYF